MLYNLLLNLKNQVYLRVHLMELVWTILSINVIYTFS